LLEVQELQQIQLQETVPCFISESNAIQDVMAFIRMVAKSPDTPVLIQGETGTGKELIARAIHYYSPNFRASFATVNCAAIPEDLIESELFGYEKGAFSGAGADGKKGLIEEAANGTLFLDEIGDLSLQAQAKLLRFLESGEYYRVGGTRKLHIQTRVVSATNKILPRMIEDGKFRRDLYFRLGVIKVQVPSLNERPEDIIPLAKYFMRQFSDKFKKTFTALTTEAEAALMAHDWSGNVRELKNAIEGAVLVGRGPKLRRQDLDPTLQQLTTKLQLPKQKIERYPFPPEGIDLASQLQSVEKNYFAAALKRAGGNASMAARLLNMNHHTFRYRRKKLLIE